MAQADHVINALRAWNTGAIAGPSTSPVSNPAECVAAGLGLLLQLYSRSRRRPPPTGGRND
jgi:hypothetical protein